MLGNSAFEARSWTSKAGCPSLPRVAGRGHTQCRLVLCFQKWRVLALPSGQPTQPKRSTKTTGLHLGPAEGGRDRQAAGPVSLRPAPPPEGVPSSDPAQLRASWGPQEVVWLSPDCVTRCHVLPGWVPQMLGGLSARVWQRMGLTQRGIHPAPSWGFVGTQAPRGGQRMLLLPCLTLSLPYPLAATRVEFMSVPTQLKITDFRENLFLSFSTSQKIIWCFSSRSKEH